MERKFRYGIWKMPEWNERFQEWNGRQSSILPYQILCIVFTEKYIPMSGSDKYYCHRSIQLQYQRILFVDKSRYSGCVHCIIVSTLEFCSIDVTVDDLDKFDLLFFFILRLTICPVVNFVFLHRQETSYLLFYPRVSLILLILLVFKLIVILLGVKAWYFYYGKCSS